MKLLALSAITFYQRLISPYKGFCCAYRVHSGHASCSVLGYRAIRRFGVWHGVRILRQRLARCGAVHHGVSLAPVIRHRQAGFCDLSCDFDVADMACDGCDCGDWWGSRKQRKKKK